MAALLTETPIDAPALLDGFMRQASEAGGIVSFCGVARGEGGEGEAVATLRLDRHPMLTQASLDAILASARQRFAVIDLLVVHRWGPIAPREVVVFVAAAARHRRAAFEAADYLMDRLKTEAVFWKREEGADGGRWIEPTDADHTARDRWAAA